MRCVILLAGCIFQCSSYPVSSDPPPPQTKNVGFPKFDELPTTYLASRGLRSPLFSSLLANFEPVEMHVSEYRDDSFDGRTVPKQRRYALIREHQQHEQDFQLAMDFPSLTSIFQNAMETIKRARTILSRYIESPFGSVERVSIETPIRRVKNFVVNLHNPEIFRNLRNTRVMQLTDSYLSEPRLGPNLGPPPDANAVAEDSAPPIAVPEQPEEHVEMHETTSTTEVMKDDGDSDIQSTESALKNSDFVSAPVQSEDEAQETTTTTPSEVTTDDSAYEIQSTTFGGSQEVIESIPTTTFPEKAPPDTAEKIEADDSAAASNLGTPLPIRSDQVEDEEPFPAKLIVKEFDAADESNPQELVTYQLKKKKK